MSCSRDHVPFLRFAGSLKKYSSLLNGDQPVFIPMDKHDRARADRSYHVSWAGCEEVRASFKRSESGTHVQTNLLKARWQRVADHFGDIERPGVGCVKVKSFDPPVNGCSEDERGRSHTPANPSHVLAVRWVVNPQHVDATDDVVFLLLAVGYGMAAALSVSTEVKSENVESSFVQARYEFEHVGLIGTDSVADHNSCPDFNIGTPNQ